VKTLNIPVNKNVCLVSHSSGKGGAEFALLMLIDVLNDWGFHCHVLMPRPGPLVAELEKRQVEYAIIPYGYWMAESTSFIKIIASIILHLFTTPLVFLRLIKWKSDIIISNSLVVCVGSLANILLRRPHLWFIHEFGKEDHGLKFKFGEQFSLWLVDKLSSLVITDSQAVKNKFQEVIKPAKLKLLYYYRSIDSFPKMTASCNISNKITCICIGRLFLGKGQEDAIKAVKELAKDEIPVQLVLVGRGDVAYTNYLQKLVEKEGLSQYVTFTGWIDNPFPVLQKADIFLMCSHSEAFGYVTVEAMLHQKPIIGARSGGTVELVHDGFNGLLYTPGDYLELAAKIKYLYQNPNLIQEYGRNGYLWAKRTFNAEVYKNNLCDLLKPFLTSS
jgi:glycosyltransferase involved in cell wall biosynthesis